MSRRSERRRRERGLCPRCGRPAVHGFNCAKHALEQRLFMRAHDKTAAWRPSGPGRPPRFTDAELREMARKESHE